MLAAIGGVVVVAGEWRRKQCSAALSCMDAVRTLSELSLKVIGLVTVERRRLTVFVAVVFVVSEPVGHCRLA